MNMWPCISLKKEFDVYPQNITIGGYAMQLLDMTGRVFGRWTVNNFTLLDRMDAMLSGNVAAPVELFAMFAEALCGMATRKVVVA